MPRSSVFPLFPARRRAKRARRRLAVESLEPRQLFNVAWRNPADALDATADQRITPQDALAVINQLNSRAHGPLPPGRATGEPFCDVNGDESLTTQDALAVINALNAGLRGRRSLGGETANFEAGVTITVGQPAGVRLYQLRFEGHLAGDDRVTVFMRDPANPALALLDSGQPGTPLFEWTATGANFPESYVRWDGESLTLALPHFHGRATAELKVEYSAGGLPAGGGLTVTPLSNVVDAATTWPPFASSTTLPLTTHLSAASDPNGNGVVLKSQVTLEGLTAPNASVNITGHNHLISITADASGHYSAPVNVQPGDSEFQVSVVDGLGRHGFQKVNIRYADVVLDWNAALLTVVRDWTALSNDPYPNRIVLSPPPVVARNLAMVHAAMFDAINAVERLFQFYQADLAAPAGASSVVAAAAAAQRVASRLYTAPDEQAVFSASLVETLQSVEDGPAKTHGLALGQQVGDAILAWRAGDGASATRAYTPGTQPGQWQRTFPDFFPPLLPQWPGVKPFAMTSVEQFRAPPPPSLDSAAYAAAVDEVQRLGGFANSERTAEQTEIAIFWADGGGTFTPVGHWNQIAADVAVSRNESLAENARTFAMLNVAMADAGINSWDAKYHYDFWRPIAAIRQAAIDGNPLTTADPNWIPLIRTPNFPTYTSGHSTFSAAAAAVLTDVFGENVEFTSVADQHSGFSERPLADDLIVSRSFSSFAEAAHEASRSRVYGGIHFEFDSAAGYEAGEAIGQYVAANFFNPL